MRYSKEFKVFVATIYGEAGNSSIRSWEVIAHSILNRIGFGNWTSFTTPYGIVTKTGYDAYTQKNKPYRTAINQLNTGQIDNTLELLIKVVKPIYEGKTKDDTRV